MRFTTAGGRSGRSLIRKRSLPKSNRVTPTYRRISFPASELIRQQQDILARNGENQRKRQNLQYIQNQAATIQRQLDELLEKQVLILKDLETAQKSALDLHDESTDELEQNITNIEQINRKVRANLDKAKAEDDAGDYGDQYAKLTTEIDNIRQSKTDLLKSADLPLPGLAVTDGEG